MCRATCTEAEHEQVGVSALEGFLAQQASLTGSDDGVRTTGDDDGRLGWVDHNLEKVVNPAAS